MVFTDPSAAAEPPTIRLREDEETPSRFWILTDRDNDAGRNARENPERLLFLDDLAVVWPSDAQLYIGLPILSYVYPIF